MDTRSRGLGLGELQVSPSVPKCPQVLGKSPSRGVAACTRRSRDGDTWGHLKFAEFKLRRKNSLRFRAAGRDVQGADYIGGRGPPRPPPCDSARIWQKFAKVCRSAPSKMSCSLAKVCSLWACRAGLQSDCENLQISKNFTIPPCIDSVMRLGQVRAWCGWIVACEFRLSYRARIG